MTRPLIVSDCDEVILHMIIPFSEWLAQNQGIDFHLNHGFDEAMRYQDGGRLVPPDEVFRLLNLFFDNEMHRQVLIPGAHAALGELAEHADIVVLTNLLDHHREARTLQLAGHGLPLRVFTNQGPKGPALRRILDEYRPSRALFIDDLAQHHGSVASLLPEVQRLHLCGEPQLAPHISCAQKAGHAHARLDTWEQALPWLLARVHGEALDEVAV